MIGIAMEAMVIFGFLLGLYAAGPLLDRWAK